MRVVQPVAARVVHLQFLVLVLFLVAVAFAAPRSEARPTPPGEQEVASRAEEYMAARVRRDRFSGSVLIARDGKVLFSRGFGMANLEHDVPNTPDTRFRLASITKQFTAMAVLILQERGKLDVTDPVRKYLPDAPAAWDAITVEHLLTHTSGIPNYTSFPDFLKTLPVRVTLPGLIGKFKDKPLDFKPGEKYQYSNSGYIVLGQIIEKASGQPYATFLKEAIFDPLDMKDSGYDLAQPILKHRASGYVRRLGVLLTHCDYVDMSIPHAAGALYSTVTDLVRWDQALSTEKLVPRKRLEAMFTPRKSNYGYGWIIDQALGRKRYLHAGGIMGFATMIERFPEEKVLVVALSNVEKSPVGSICTDLAAIALGARYVVPRTPSEAKLDPAILDACAGRYEAEIPGRGKQVVTIARDGARLTAEVKGKFKKVLIPESSELFYIRGDDSEARFLRDAKGRATHLVLIHDGRDVTAPRLPDETPEPRPTPGAGR